MLSVQIVTMARSVMKRQRLGLEQADMPIITVYI